MSSLPKDHAKRGQTAQHTPGLRTYRGTFETENNGPVITAEFVDASVARDLLAALRSLTELYRTNINADPFFLARADAAIARAGQS